MEPSGMHARWAAMQARHIRDQVSRDVDKICAAWRASHGVDAGRMLADLAEDVRVIEAGRAARAQRNAPKAQRAWRAYSAARERFAAERDQDYQPAGQPSVLVAAAMGLGADRVQIF